VKLDGEHAFDAPREIVWGVISDPAQMAELMPGVQSFEVADPTHFRANVKIPLGLGGLAMAIDFEKLEEREPEFSSLRAHGRGVGAMMKMQTSFTLEPLLERTRMLWSAEVSIAGPVGAMGQRVLQPIFRQQVDHILATLEQQVAAALAQGGGPGSVGAAPADPPAAAEQAAAGPAPAES
jgi:carbon monoxide dehydrogenase subunit G